MKTIRDIESLKGKTLFVRVDFNVPIKNGVVVNDYRIKQTLPTIAYLREKGARVILAGHLESDETKSFNIVSERLQTDVPHTFIPDIFADSCRDIIRKMKNGDVVLLENLRKWPGEKADDISFAKYLASLCDIYVNEAFSVSHREHASIVGVPMYRSAYAGLQLENEVKHLSKMFNPPHPFLFILGGAKFDTKIPLVKKFLHRADTIFIGGALANDVFKAKGLDVGTSIVSDEKIDFSNILAADNIILPVDVVVERKGKQIAIPPKEVTKKDFIWDAGPETIEMLGREIAKSRCVLWNGPLGFYEKGYQKATLEVARMLGEDETESIVGGGDTLAAIEELQNHDNFSFISTGGGAMLDFLANETLPGIEVLEK